jgi:predicted ferric reductase
MGDNLVLHFERQPGFSYRPGQFAYLNIRGSGDPAIDAQQHPFSFLSAPDDHHLSFGVRAVGDYTTALAGLAVGTQAAISGGYGDFVPGYSAPTCLIGTGIGIVPILSILKAAARHRPAMLVTAILAARKREDFLGHDGEELAGADGRMDVHCIVTSESRQRITRELLAERLEAPQRTDYYVCASEPVRFRILQELESLRVDRRRIHFESFEVSPAKGAVPSERTS